MKQYKFEKIAGIRPSVNYLRNPKYKFEKIAAQYTMPSPYPERQYPMDGMVVNHDYPEYSQMEEDDRERQDLLHTDLFGWMRDMEEPNWLTDSRTGTKFYYKDGTSTVVLENGSEMPSTQFWNYLTWYDTPTPTPEQMSAGNRRYNATVHGPAVNLPPDDPRIAGLNELNNIANREHTLEGRNRVLATTISNPWMLSPSAQAAIASGIVPPMSRIPTTDEYIAGANNSNNNIEFADAQQRARLRMGQANMNANADALIEQRAQERERNRQMQAQANRHHALKFVNTYGQEWIRKQNDWNKLTDDQKADRWMAVPQTERARYFRNATSGGKVAPGSVRGDLRDRVAYSNPPTDFSNVSSEEKNRVDNAGKNYNQIYENYRRNQEALWGNRWRARGKSEKEINDYLDNMTNKYMANMGLVNPYTTYNNAQDTWRLAQAQPSAPATVQPSAPAQPPVQSTTTASAPAQPPVQPLTPVQTPAPAQPPVQSTTTASAPAQPPVQTSTSAPITDPVQPTTFSGGDDVDLLDNTLVNPLE